MLHDYVSLMSNTTAQEQIVRKPHLYFALFECLLKQQQPNSTTTATVGQTQPNERLLFFALLNTEDVLTKLVKFVITTAVLTANRYRNRNEFRLVLHASIQYNMSVFSGNAI